MFRLSPTPLVSEQRVRDRAHDIWESEGRPEGRGEEHWHRAMVEGQVEEYRAQAEGCGANAAQTHHEQIRREWERLAQDWLRMAGEAEQAAARLNEPQGLSPELGSVPHLELHESDDQGVARDVTYPDTAVPRRDYGLKKLAAAFLGRWPRYRPRSVPGLQRCPILYEHHR